MNFFWRAAVCINIYERIYFPSFHQVHDDEILCPFCSKKCKSVGGLKRHVTQCKHKDERENGPETDESRKQIYKRITRKDSRGSQTNASRFDRRLFRSKVVSIDKSHFDRR